MKKLLLNSKLFVITFVIANLFLFNATSFAQTSTATGGNWNTTTTWVGGVVPVAGGTVVIATTGANFVEMDVAVTQTAAGSVTVNSGATLSMNTAGISHTFGALTINGTGLFTVNRQLTVTGATNITGTISFGSTSGTSRTMTFTGNVTLNAGAVWTEPAAGNGANDTYSFGGNFTNNATTFNALGTGVHDFTGAAKTIGGTTITSIPTATVTISGTYTNNGTLTINGALDNGGTLANAGTINITGAATSNFLVANFTNTGTINLNTSGTITGITNNAGGIVNETNSGTITSFNNATATSTLNISDLTVSTFTTLTLTTAGNTVNYNGAGAQTVRTATTFSNLILSGSGAKTTTGVTIAASGKLSMEGTATATVSPTYTAGATLEYKGSAPQITTNTEFITVPNLIIDNASGVTLNAAKTVSGTLTLTNGNLIIPSGLTLTLSGTGAIAGTGFSAAKSVVTQVNTGTGAKGFLRVSIPAVTLRSIPVSDGTNYLPVDLTPTNANTYDVCVFNGVTNTGEPNGTAFTPAQKAICVNAVWYINLTAGAVGAGVTMTTQWPVGLEGATFSTYTNAQIGISHYNNVTPIWEPCTGNGITGPPKAATRSAIITFSPFGVGRVNSSLPVSISYFNAAKGNGFNTLNWQAACSTDKAVFEIERSTDGRNFTTINTVTATQAQCAQSVNYVDNTSLTGTVFYRIKSVDINGKASYSVIIKLGAQQSDMKFAGVLPNPVSNVAQLNIVTSKKDNVELSILSMEGKTVQRSTVQLQPGSSILSLDVANLQKGLYIIKGVFGNGETSSIKFVKQ